MISLQFLGTSCMQPTKDRNHSSVFLEFDGVGLLFDCGENTQRQMKIAGISPSRIDAIFISHWHGDHVLGIPGLIQTMGANDYSGTLRVFGPEGTEERFKHMFKAFAFESFIPLEVKDVSEPKVLCNTLFEVHSAELDHSVPCLGFSFIEKDRRRIKVASVKKLGMAQGPLLGKLQRGNAVEWRGKKISPDEVTYIVKGKKITYIVDTAPCSSAIELAKNSDVLICESAYVSDLEEKGREYKHLTAKDAAYIAQMSDAKRLILTHFSQRYKSTEKILDEAKQLFQEVDCAFDFAKYKI